MGEDPKAFIKRMGGRPSDSASILGESSRNVLLLAGAVELRRKRIEEAQRQRDAQLILENIREHQVFFYPGSSYDLEPLHRFTHQCDTFIFCDWHTQPGAVTGGFQSHGLTTEFVVDLDTETVRYLADASPNKSLPGMSWPIPVLRYSANRYLTTHRSIDLGHLTAMA